MSEAGNGAYIRQQTRYVRSSAYRNEAHFARMLLQTTFKVCNINAPIGSEFYQFMRATIPGQEIGMMLEARCQHQFVRLKHNAVCQQVECLGRIAYKHDFMRGGIAADKAQNDITCMFIEMC